MKTASATTVWNTGDAAGAGGGGNPRNSRGSHRNDTPSIEEYAQTLLERYAREPPDDSLGAYVTAVLRTRQVDPPSTTTTTIVNNNNDDDDDETMAAMIELLTEHAHMTTSCAQAVLRDIAHAVRRGRVVEPFRPSSHRDGTAAFLDPSSSSVWLPCFLLPESEHEQPPPPSPSETFSEQKNDDSVTAADATKPIEPLSLLLPPGSHAVESLSAGSVLSPLHEDNLIPVDLLGCLDDEEREVSVAVPAPALASSSSSSLSKFPNQLQRPSRRGNEQQLPYPEQEQPDPFPPLGTSYGSSSSSSDPVSKKAMRKAAVSKSLTAHTSTTMLSPPSPPVCSSLTTTATDFAATLFRPSQRSRPNSMDEETTTTHSSVSSSQQEIKNSNSLSPALQPTYPLSSSSFHHPANPTMLLYPSPAPAPPPSSTSSSSTPYYHYPTTAAATTTATIITNHDPYYYAQLQLQSTMEILLSMNTNLSESAAAEAARVSDGDINVAQYLVDTASTAPPVCRHLLSDGCYRRDCQFSHDIDTHTCLFWMKGRCGKGDSCRFLHGFATKVVSQVLLEQQHQQQQQAQQSSTSAVDYPGTFGENQPYPGSTVAGSAGWGNVSTATTTQQQPSSFSFANVASQNYHQSSSFANDRAPTSSAASLTSSTTSLNMASSRTVRIPQDLWTPHDHRDASAFQIPDPMERYQYVMSCARCRPDVVDLHFQSTKTFATVLSTVLPEKLYHDGLEQVWIVTGTGHHVGTQTHQKGGGALENAVVAWLAEQGYNHARGKDRNGQGGAILVER